MSVITNVILIVNICNESFDRKIKFLNLYLQSQNHLPLEESKADGGEKVLTARIYIGSFNCFDYLEFIQQVKSNFNHLDDAFQVFVREEDKYQFELKAVQVPKWI